MKLKDELKEISHHAYAIAGHLRDEVILLAEKIYGTSFQGNPDIYNRTFEVFAIDDARELKSLHETRPVSEDGKKFFFIQANGVTVEAQNALLKLFEEPAEYAHFFLIIPSISLLLPTVKSRVRIIQGESTENAYSEKEAKAFVSASMAERLEIVKKLVDDISKEKKTKQDALQFLDGVQAYIHKHVGIKKGMAALRAIDESRAYLTDRAPSVKMLLEFVAMSV